MFNVPLSCQDKTAKIKPFCNLFLCVIIIILTLEFLSIYLDISDTNRMLCKILYKHNVTNVTNADASMIRWCISVNRHSQVFPWYDTTKIRPQVSVCFFGLRMCTHMCVCVRIHLTSCVHSCWFACMKGTYRDSRWVSFMRVSWTWTPFKLEV